MFPKNINILGHCVYPKTENNFDLIDTFSNHQSGADKIHKNYKNTSEVVFNFLFYPVCIRPFVFVYGNWEIEQGIHNRTCFMTARWISKSWLLMDQSF